jgi:hypothetical protein
MLRTALPAALLALALGPAPARAQVGEDAPPPDAPPEVPVSTATQPLYFFHRPDLEFGSAARFSPLSVLLDRGFSTLMWDPAERHPLRIDWNRGWSSVGDALAHPLDAIERSGGLGPVLRREFLPEDWSVWEWAFAANYMGHAVNGGITYRALSEWFHEQGVPLPRVAGAASVIGSILVNEAIESREFDYGVASTTFDVYVFEPLGIALFSLDGVARFFSSTLHARDWSPQSSITLPTGQLLNGAQMMSYHLALPWWERLDLLSVTGQGTQTGLLWDLDRQSSIGGAFGFASKAREVDAQGRERLEARASGSLYLAREGSLVASFTVFRAMDNLAALNLYPGLMGGRFRQVGLWAVLRRGGDFSLGLTTGRVPGLGLGYDFWRRPEG